MQKRVVKVELGSIDIFVQAYKNTMGDLAGIKSKLTSANDELGMLVSSLASLPQTGKDLVAILKDMGLDSEKAKVDAVNTSIDNMLKTLNPLYKTIEASVKKI